MTDQQLDLERESRAFSRFLTGGLPNEYVTNTYVRAHMLQPTYNMGSPFELWCVAFARRGPLFTRLADAYAVFFAGTSLLRRKLVLMYAILETCSPSHRLFDEGDPRPALILYTVLVKRLVVSMLLVLVATPLFSLARLATTLNRGSS